MAVTNPHLDSPQDEQLYYIDIYECDVNTGDILMNIWDIYGRRSFIERVGDGAMSAINAGWRPRQLRRLRVVNEGDGKYKFPSGKGIHPYFPPALCQKFADKVEIKTLILTEGFFKAQKGSMEGLDVVGLPSISHFREDKKLPADVIALISRCNVKNIIVLADGDIRNLASKALEPARSSWEKQKDATERLWNFYNFGTGIAEAVKNSPEFEVTVFFAHLKSERFKDTPKGLDDYLIAASAFGNVEEFKDELVSTDVTRQNYVYKLNITNKATALLNYLHLKNVDSFYDFYADLIGPLTFNFKGTLYQYNEESGKCEVTVPGDASNYIRVGDDYYELYQKPNSRGQHNQILEKRQKSTITDDYGKSFIRFIQKFKSFVNIPSHTEYQAHLDNCYNMYHPIAHEPVEGDCPTTIDFIRHIFGDGEILYKDKVYKEYELGLDYLQLMYLKPTQVLPILCLVSPENHTGKSLFGEKWLRDIFGHNAITIGNDELSSNFNSIFMTRLVVFVDEVAIDKQPVMEKLKRLSTAQTTVVNEKNIKQTEVDIFCKFILSSNNDRNFIKVGDNDIRYWIRRIPKPKTRDMDLYKKLKDEIPYFLDFLCKRKLTTENESRMHFAPELLATDELQKLRRHSEPKPAQELRSMLKELFLEGEEKEIQMPLKEINTEFFKGRMEDSYLQIILEEYLKVGRLLDEQGKSKHTRGKYRRFEKIWMEASLEFETKTITINWIGRPYVFKRETFVSVSEEVLAPSTESDGDLPF
jgi:hypothetical protein